MSQAVKQKRFLALLVALCVTATCFITGGATALAAEGDLAASAIGATKITGEELDVQAGNATAQWVTVNFNLASNLKKLNIKWDWNDLLQDATKAKENKNLLVASIVMSEEAELSKARVESTLEAIGFGDIQSDYYKLSTKTKNDVNQPARTFGHKTITKNGKKYHVVCAVFKGTTTLDDALTDIESIKDGFLKAGQNCANSLASYVSTIDGATKENTILFITGHSLGASTANVVGRLSGDLAYDKAKFVYSIASPNYELGDDEGKKAPNFRTFTNTADAVPYVPPRLSSNNVGKIGIEHNYTYKNLSKAKSGKFNKVYRYLTNKWYEDDMKASRAVKALRNHLCQTYMSFALCDLSSSEIDRYLGMSRENGLTVKAKSVKVEPNKKTVLKRSKVLAVTGANGKVTYSKKAGISGITVAKNGTVTVKKGVLPGIHLVRITVKAAGDGFYYPKTVTKTVKITVKLVPNPIKIVPKKVSVIEGKTTVLKLSDIFKVRNAKGKIAFSKKSGNKYITVKKNGSIVVKKGLKAGTYRVKVVAKVQGTRIHAKATITKTVTIRVKTS